MTDKTGGSVFQRMGLTPVINAGGTNTKHSGSRMRPEVIEAMLTSLSCARFVNRIFMALSKLARVRDTPKKGSL